MPPETRILLISGNDDEIELYTLGLGHESVDVTPARTPDEALGALTARRFDAVVYQLDASSEESWSFCESLRQEAAPSLPLVVLTAHVRPDGRNRDRARQIGCAGFVAKPCPPERLAQILSRVVGGERGLEFVGTDSWE